MKKLAKWLSEHAWVLGGGGKDSVLHLWCVLSAMLFFIVVGLTGWNGDGFVLSLGILCLGTSVLPPIVAGIIALVKRQKWNPWYWFPMAIGVAFGGFIGSFICFVFGWHG